MQPLKKFQQWSDFRFAFEEGHWDAKVTDVLGWDQRARE
jgi:hypothetical protein